MQKNWTVFLTVLFSVLTLSAAPNGYIKPPAFILKFSPQYMVRSGLWLSGEIFNEKHNVSNQISLEAIYSKPVSGKGVYESTGFTTEYMFRYYPSGMHVQKTLQKEYIKGFYVGLFGQAGSYTQKEHVNSAYDATVRSTTFFPGFIMGMQQSLGESMYLDLYMGAGMRISNPIATTNYPGYEINNYFMLYNSGVFPKIGLSLGFGQ